MSNNPFSILAIADALDAPPAEDPRDREPPPAPKKSKPDTPSPNDVTAIPLFWESAPGAPVANRTRTVKLSTMPMALINLASAYICAGFVPLYGAYKDDVLDGEYEAVYARCTPTACGLLLYACENTSQGQSTKIEK